MGSSWPFCAFVVGVKIGSGRRSDSRRPRGGRGPDGRAGRQVVLPPGAGEVAADDALDRQHLEAPALGRAAVVAQREQVVRDEVARPREPESREPGEHAALVGDLGRKDDVEHRDAVARDEQQTLVVERVELAHLAASDVHGGLRHGRLLLDARAVQPLEDRVDVAVRREREQLV